MSLVRRFVTRQNVIMLVTMLALALVFVVIPNAAAHAQEFPTPAPDTELTVMNVKGTAQGLGLWAIAILALVIGLAILVARKTKRF